MAERAVRVWLTAFLIVETLAAGAAHAQSLRQVVDPYQFRLGATLVCQTSLSDCRLLPSGSGGQCGYTPSVMCEVLNVYLAMPGAQGRPDSVNARMSQYQTPQPGHTQELDFWVTPDQAESVSGTASIVQQGPVTSYGFAPASVHLDLSASSTAGARVSSVSLRGNATTDGFGQMTGGTVDVTFVGMTHGDVFSPDFTTALTLAAAYAAVTVPPLPSTFSIRAVWERPHVVSYPAQRSLHTAVVGTRIQADVYITVKRADRYARETISLQVTRGNELVAGTEDDLGLPAGGRRWNADPLTIKLPRAGKYRLSVTVTIGSTQKVAHSILLVKKGASW